MAIRSVAYGVRSDFDPIRPDERDRFTFDFSVPATGTTIATGALTCALADDSPVDDPDASTRVLSTPTVSVGKITALVGTMLNGVVYRLTSTASFADGRVLAWDAAVECSLDPLPASDVLTPAQFRHDFPAFASPSAYPDEAIAYWIDVVLTQVPMDPNRWSQNLRLGQELFVAHMLTLERQNQLATSRGQPAMAAGPAVSRSVGGVSVSYDLSGAYYQDAGFWNLTTYGQRYWYYLNQAGMGPLQY